MRINLLHISSSHPPVMPSYYVNPKLVGYDETTSSFPVVNSGNVTEAEDEIRPNIKLWPAS